MIAAIVLSFIIAWYLLRPFFASAVTSGGEVVSDRESLLDQKERCLQVLKDLELDFSLKKISDKDYATMKSSLQRELATVLQRLKG